MWAQVHAQLQPADSSPEASMSSPAEAVGGYYARSGGKNGMSGGLGRGLSIGWLLAERPAASRPDETEGGAAQAGSDADASTGDISARPVLYTWLRARCTSSPSSLPGKYRMTSSIPLKNPTGGCVLIIWGSDDIVWG